MRYSSAHCVTFVAGALFVSVALSCGAAAAAQQRSLSEAVTVEPGATCIEKASLVEQVESWIGGAETDASLTIDVRGSPDRPRVVEFFVLQAGRVVASRRFDPGPARCEQLHAVLGLAIAMALKASIVEEIAPVSARPETAPPTPPVKITPSPVVAIPWAFAASAIASVGVLPDPGYGLGLRVERVLAPPFRVRLGLSGLVALAEAFPGEPGLFNSRFLASRLDVCAGGEPVRRVHLDACVGMSAGELFVQGYGLPSSRSDSIPWVAVANELAVRVDVTPRWAVEASASLLLPVIRDGIVLRDNSGNPLPGGEREPANIGWMFGLGPALRF